MRSRRYRKRGGNLLVDAQDFLTGKPKTEQPVSKQDPLGLKSGIQSLGNKFNELKNNITQPQPNTPPQSYGGSRRRSRRNRRNRRSSRR